MTTVDPEHARRLEAMTRDELREHHETAKETARRMDRDVAELTAHLDDIDDDERDFDDAARLLDEVRYIVATDDKHGIGLDGDPADRTLALAEVTFLLGRLAVLAACDWHEQQQRRALAEKAIENAVRSGKLERIPGPDGDRIREKK